MDITLDDVTYAIKEGFTTMEDIKRYVGVGTGPCQGKTCLSMLAGVLRSHFKKSIDEIGLTRVRPPFNPVSFKTLAGDTDEE
jgi:bacterioferritin-associated ferredoxin